eukprot:jgi/Bigna1/53629/estExt_Genewise1Plus.C_220029
MSSGTFRNTFEAMHSNDLPHLKRLISENANIEECGCDGETPLIAGSCEGRFEIVKYLVDMKANIEARDKHGGYQC